MNTQDLKLKVAELKDTIVYLCKELELSKNKNKMENKETVEEAAEKANGYNLYAKGTKGQAFDEGFIAGANWQAERSYSEEDLISFAHFYFQEEFNSSMQNSKSTKDIFTEWFEQFKKK